MRRFEPENTVKITDRRVDTDVKKVENMNAFEALMSAGSQGDTLKRTPVRKRVKRLDKIASKNKSLLDWVTKGGQ